jgi:chromosome segregation ATPase
MVFNRKSIMKYVFAALLVVLALIFVFHIERIVPMPRALGTIMSSTLGPHIPFGVKAAYAESCIAGIEAKQERVQYAVSESAVRIQELDRQIESWSRQLHSSVARLRVLVNQSAEIASETIGREVQRHDDLQWKIAQAQALRKRLEDTVKSLEQAEGKASQKVVELRGRLEMVKLDHERNNA